MSARVMLVLLFLAVVLIVALGTMLLVGYVPAHAHGPQNERTFSVLGGFTCGLLIAAGFGQFEGVRR
jgi:hypothetical protein